ncbi:MAG: hypothetical protein AAF739_00625 [Pseudomonadota bacterium]
MTKVVKGWIMRIIGWGLTVLGFVMFVLPIPLGIPVMATGMMILITTSKTARRWFRFIRMRSPVTDKSFSYIETRVPARIGAVLRKTRFRAIGRKVAQAVRQGDPA